MKNDRKKYCSIILILVLLFSLIVTVGAIQPQASGDTPTVLVGDDENNYVMTGVHNTSLLVESISSAEYSALMGILYPNGVVDAQGQEIGGINNMDEVRAQYIAANMKAYSVTGSVQTEVNLSPFEITIESQSNGTFAALLYSCSIGQDTFVFPSEWGCQPFGFTHLSEENLYFIFTDIGIWKIDPISETATRITADSYMGETRSEIAEGIADAQPDKYLIWIDNVEISPNGEYVVYRTNRDAAILDETSVWKINLNSNSEEQFVTPAEDNDIVGFVADDTIVTGALDNTKMINLVDNGVTAVEIPELSNACVRSVKNGKILFSSYLDGTSATTLYINNIDVETGSLSEITTVSGYLDGEPDFSPSGNKIAVGYGTNSLTGTDDVMIVDTVVNTQSLLSDLMPATRSTQTISSNVTHCLWINDDTILVNVQEENNIPSVEDTPSLLSSYSIVFGNTPPVILNFNSPLSSSSTSGFSLVNSKWNQPRNVTGSNPHQGVDLQASLNTPVYAPYAGWIEAISDGAGSKDIQFLVDANKNGNKDDGDYYIRFYHMNAREADGYRTQGQKIGLSGNQGTSSAHLHFGICSNSGGLKWLRNEVNYRHLSSSNWASGQDLDIYAQVGWTNSRASIIAYIRDDGVKKDLSEVRIYYRTTPSGTWTDGGVMTKSGSTYTYDFSSKFSSGTTVYWMVRMLRENVSQAVFCPAKYYQPNNNPNAVSQTYGYWTNTLN